MKPEEEKDENLERLIDSVLSGEQERKLIQQIMTKAYNIGFAKGRRTTLHQLQNEQAEISVEQLNKLNEELRKERAVKKDMLGMIASFLNQIKEMYDK